MKTYDDSLLQQFEFATEVISGIRTIRKEKNIPFKDVLSLSVLNNENVDSNWDTTIEKLGNIDSLVYVTAPVEGALSFRVKSNEYFVPVQGTVDVVAEIAKIEEELAYTEGFLRSVRGKLSNEKFVSGAPEKVEEMERKKEADALATIETLKQSLKNLK